MRIGVDVGGTFTDLVAADEGGIRVLKVPTTPDQAEAIRDVLGRATAEHAEPDEILHGTTVATNAVLERRGATLGFACTAGFRHLLHLARQDRPSLYDLRAVRPEPLAELDHCVAIPERVGPHGEVIQPLDEASARRALASLRGRIDALAVTLLHSYANPRHERRVRELAAEELPGVAVSLSSDVLREFREYERASTTALNAYVRPAAGGYLERLVQTLGAARLAVMWSGGGLRGVGESARLPVHLMLSGPAAGVLGAAWVAARAGFSNVVAFDMGGTSTDVSIVEGGVAGVAEESSLGGLPFRTPCIDVVSVGAGGGSVAWIDSGGALRVGPRSAGATPGPAGYGRGGTEATVTDAHLVLGHLGAEGLAGGELPLDAELARRAVSQIGEDARMTLDEAAAGIVRIVRATMSRAIRSVSIERGTDVRDYALVAFGGAGPMHGVALARELGMRAVIVPPAPGALAAFGLLVARRRADTSLTRPTPADPSSDAELREVTEELTRAASATLSREGVETAESVAWADCRYAGQSYELRIEAGDGFAAVRRRFDDAHRARYGFARPDVPVEAVTFRAAALGPDAGVRLAPMVAGRTPSPVGRRQVGGTAVPVFARSDLPEGFALEGPAIVAELDATTWLDGGSRAVVHSSGALVVDPGGA